MSRIRTNVDCNREEKRDDFVSWFSHLLHLWSEEFFIFPSSFSLLFFFFLLFCERIFRLINAARQNEDENKEGRK